jgi:hypothetical protein
MISPAIQTVLVRGRRRAAGTQRRPECLRIAPAFLSARTAAATAAAADHLVGLIEVARIKPLSGGVPGARVDSNPMPKTIL